MRKQILVSKAFIPCFSSFFLYIPLLVSSSRAFAQPATAVAGTAAASPACHIDGGAALPWPVTVIDTSGAAVGGAQIDLHCGATSVAGQTDAHGQVRLPVQPGAWQLTVEAPGFAPAQQSIQVNADAQGSAVVLRVGPASSTILITAGDPFAVRTEAAMKMEIPLMETPQAISIVNRELLDSEGVVKLEDALKNVAGVMAGGYYDGWDYYRIRGFDASFNTYIDGLRSGNGLGEETWGIESVDVLKGPSSALYGQSVLGGLVDLITRKPVPANFAHLQLTAGSFNELDPALDIGRTLNRSHTLYGRLAAIYRSNDTFVDYTWHHRYYFDPSLTWRPTPATRLTLIGRIQRDNGRQGMPLPAIGTVLPNVNGQIPISLYNGELEANANKLAQATQQFGYEFAQSFGQHLSLHQDARFAWYQNDWNRIYYPGYLSADERTLYRYPLSWHGPWQTHEVDTHLDATGNFLGINHAALIGFDFYRSPSTGIGYSIDFSDLSQYEPLDLFRPIYGANPLQPLSLYTDSHTVTQYAGIYLQDHIRLPRRVTLTGGGRLDLAKNESEGSPNQNGRGWKPRLGLTWQPIPSTMIYASFSKSYLPQSGQVYNGSTTGSYLAPERGRQWEAGTKNSLWNGHLVATLAAFQLNRNNVSTTDPAHPNFYLTTGEQRSRGVELEGTLHPLAGWNITTAYSRIHAEVLHDTTLPPGTPTINAPRNLFNVWTTYVVPRGTLRGVGLGLGGRHYTDQSGDLADTFQLPGYGVVDASLSYQTERLHWQVNADNVGDTRYASGSYSNLYVKPGDPRTIRGLVSWSF